jgi:nucleotide-binding universal stress UspA family protein
MFRHILCPVDFSEHSRIALHYAEAFARSGGSKIVLLHAVPDLNQELSYIDGNYHATVCDDLMAAAVSKLNDFGPPDSDAYPVERKVRLGNPVDTILQEAETSAANVIVMGTHGWGGYERFLLGSVTNKVLHKSVVPVLVVCHPTHDFANQKEQSIHIRRVLCAIELQPSDSKVVDLADSIANHFNSEMFVLHVARKADGFDWFEQEKVSIQKMKEMMQPKGARAELVVEAGKPTDRILYAVERYGVDLLVMGHHGGTPVRDPILGSVAFRVVSDSACPVLVYRSHQ